MSHHCLKSERKKKTKQTDVEIFKETAEDHAFWRTDTFNTNLTFSSNPHTHKILD